MKIQYINILWFMLYDLKLKWNELLLYALIYWYTQDGKNTYHWSLNYIANWLNISKRNAVNILNKLQEKKFIIKTENSHYMASEKFSPLLVKKVHSSGEKSAHNIYNNINNNINNNRAEEDINSIYNYYIKNIDVDKKYYYSSVSKKYIGEILKEEGFEWLMKIIQNYLRQVERKWRKSPKYFFNRSKRSENYLYYLDFKQEQKAPLEKKDVKNIWF